MQLDRSWIGKTTAVVLADPRAGPADRPLPGLVLGAPAVDGRLVEAYVLGLQRPASIVRGVIVALGRRTDRTAGTIVVTVGGWRPAGPTTIADRLAEAEPPVGLIVTA
jgi:hypothetical protein